MIVAAGLQTRLPGGLKNALYTLAQTATIYTVTIDLSDLDRGVFETLDLRVARHPSETAEYMLVRLLAYCLDTRKGLRSPKAYRRAMSRRSSSAT